MKNLLKKYTNSSKNNNKVHIFSRFCYCGKCGKKLICGFVKKRGDFELNCTKCKSGVFAQGKAINEAVRNHLKLPENAEITRDFLNEKFEKILIFDRKNIVLIDRGDSE